MEEIDEDILDSLMNDDVNAASEDVEGLDEELIEAIDVFAQAMRSFAEARDVDCEFHAATVPLPVLLSSTDGL